MKTFIDARQLNVILDGFEEEEWLVKSSDGDSASLGLTDAGMAEREVIFKRQSEVRRRALQGIPDREYAIVFDILHRMVNNLE
jgi:DNA-binding MarR family transcriptional regulator